MVILISTSYNVAHPFPRCQNNPFWITRLWVFPRNIRLNEKWRQWPIKYSVKGSGRKSTMTCACSGRIKVENLFTNIETEWCKWNGGPSPQWYYYDWDKRVSHYNKPLSNGSCTKMNIAMLLFRRFIANVFYLLVHSLRSICAFIL